MALFQKKGSLDDPKAIWEEFFRLVMKNDWDKSLELIGMLAKLEPINPQVHMKRGDILQRTNDSANAISSYHKAADLLAETREALKALAIYKIILRLDPEDTDAVSRSQALMGGEQTSEQSQMTYEEVEEQAGYDEEQPAGDLSYDEQAYEEQPYEEAAGEVAYTEQEHEEQYSGDEPGYEGAPSDDALNELYVEPASDSDTSVLDSPLESGGQAEEPVVSQPPAAPDGKPTVTLHGAFKKHPIFSVLSDKDIDVMIKRARHAVLKEGQVVINEGDPGDSMFIIKKGKARVVSTMFDKTYELATLGGGNFFGEVGFLTGMPRTATVVASGALSIMEINKALMQELVSRNPNVLAKLVDLSRSRTQSKMKKMGD